MIIKKKILLICLLLFTAPALSRAELPKEQIHSLYSQANQFFREANTATDPQQAERNYEQAILHFERIIGEGQVENAKLYYNLANAYFLQGRLGKAILNYRRAQKLDDSNENVQKNLTFARTKRIDKITVKTEKRVLQTLFFWHYDFSLKTKFLLTCIFFAVACLCITSLIWLGRRPAWTVSIIISGILTLCFLISVAVEYRADINKISGVITDNQVIARQGDGANYPASFKEPLHEGTEFDLLEERPAWLHIKLSDDSDAWIPQTAADLI